MSAPMTLSQPDSTLLLPDAALEADRLRLIIDHSAHGVLVVDRAQVIRFANVAAGRLLNRAASGLPGQTFGWPLTSGERAELDVSRPGAAPATLEMRVGEIAWGADVAFLVSLRDVTEQVRALQALRRAEATNAAIIESISAAVAVVDARGVVLAANSVWSEMARAPGGGVLAAVGDSYLEACRQLQDPAGACVLDGITAILQGRSDRFEMEYTPAPGTWLLLRVTPVGGPEPALVVWQHDVSDRQRAMLAAQEARLEADRQAQRDQEMRSLEQLSAASVTPVTAQAFGLEPLRRSAAAVFADLGRQYGQWLDLALEQRVHKVEHNVSEGLRGLAQQMVFYRAGPRDVMDLHLSVLKARMTAASPARAQAYAEEGRVMALELMGHLAAFYRSYVGATFSPAPPPQAD